MDNVAWLSANINNAFGGKARPSSYFRRPGGPVEFQSKEELVSAMSEAKNKDGVM